jgi:hypothetical protein
MPTGWIKLHRSLVSSDLWESEPFTRSQAWIDILIRASHRHTSVRIRGIRIDLAPGDLALAERDAAERWRWSRGKVRRFILEISSNPVPLIKVKRTNVCTVVSISDWEEHQGSSTTNSTTNSTTDSTTDSTASRTTDGPIQECKEEKEEKKKKTRKRFNPPSIDEVSSFCATAEINIDPREFVDYYQANGWKAGRVPMQDWRATARNWSRRRLKNQSNQPHLQLHKPEAKDYGFSSC